MPDGRTAAGRTIVLCLDGTSNKYARDKTNVVKLYELLDRDASDQLAYYQPGIGTMAPPGLWSKVSQSLATRLDLAIAWLLEQHTTDAYRFLMRFYRKGDSVFVFGFSRGAYTARVLAGMLHKVGLLTQGNEELVPFAWDVFRRKKNWEEAAGFKSAFGRDVSIHFLGLWDTVSSVGWMWHPQYLPFTRDNPSVEIVRHAIALDERCAYFPQNRWTDTPQRGQDVVEAWFPGVHCDVGGGYCESQSGLSKIALRWIVGHAETAGLKVNSTVKTKLLPVHDQPRQASPRCDAEIHESLRGFWWVAEYLPKRIKDPAANYAPRWIIHRGKRRFVADGAKIHTSVIDRMARVGTYRQTHLPKGYTQVP